MEGAYEVGCGWDEIFTLARYGVDEKKERNELILMVVSVSL